MTPEQASQRTALHARITQAMRALDRKPDPAERDALLVEVARYQAQFCAPYGRFVAQRAKGPLHTLADVPALPTDAFRFASITSRTDGVRTFESSGTTQDERSRHAFADLSLYDLAAELAARHALFPEGERMLLLLLVPPEDELPTSSLSYMLARFRGWFGTDDSAYVWPVDAGALIERLKAAQTSGRPVALLGTSFAFVHALDALGEARFALPARSRVMQTGGFKGKSREVAPDAMRAWLAASFGVPEAFIVAEYGMTELSSQLYETTLRDAVLGQPVGPRRLWAPPWLRATPVHPELLSPSARGEEGLVRIDDLANLDSVSAIQTADVGRSEGDGFVLLGRARGAVARGCSITADELLGAGR